MSTTSINLRLSPDTAEEFKNYCQENGITQADGFEAAIKALELTNAEDAIPDEKATIGSIRMHLDGTMDGVMTLLQHLTEADEKAHDDMQAELDAKDQEIEFLKESLNDRDKQIEDFQKSTDDLWEQAKESEQAKQIAEEKLKNAQTVAESKYKEQIARLEERVNLLDKFKMLADEKSLPQDQEYENNQSNNGYEG